MCIISISLILLISSFPLIVNAEEINFTSISNKTLYVGGDGPGNYSKIQYAIENASEGDIIFVYNGTYMENIKIEKRLEIIGETKENVIIDGQEKTDTIMIYSDGSNISNLYIKNSGSFDAGIKINSNGNYIENCIIESCWDGIEIASADNNNISNCEIRKNNWSGMIFFDSDNNTIDECIIHNNSDGVLIVSSSLNVIKNCEIKSNVGEGIELEQVSIKNIFQNNRIINNSAYGLFTYWDSDETYISKCDFENNGIGVAIGSPSRGGSKKTSILSCNIVNNKGPGLYFLGDGSLSSGTQMHYSNIYGNLYDINIGNSPRCHVKAQNNWWGSPFGPRLFGPGKTILFQLLNSRIYVYPWLKSPAGTIEIEDFDEESEKISSKMGISFLKSFFEELKEGLKEKIKTNLMKEKSNDFNLDEINNRIYNNQIQVYVDYPNDTLYVGGSGPENYSRIQDAIDNSSEGDKIFVYNGAYTENLVITKSIKISGEDRDKVVIDGDQYTNTISLNSDRITLCDLTIKNSSDFDAGIKINTNNNVINNCKIVNNWDGIELNKASLNYISNCVISTNNREGIYLFKSNNNTIINCVTTDNLEGFWLESSDNNRFENCRVEYTLEEGIQTKDSSNNIFYRCELMNIENGYAFFIQFNSDENLIYKCKISNNGVGVFFGTNAEINGPNNNVIVFSQISDNIGAGIFFYGNGALMKNTEIHYNNIFGNKYGISAISSVNCFVYAQQNWWGSQFGPKIFIIGIGDTISWNLQNGRVYFYPWLKSGI